MSSQNIVGVSRSLRSDVQLTSSVTDISRQSVSDTNSQTIEMVAWRCAEVLHLLTRTDTQKVKPAATRVTTGSKCPTCFSLSLSFIFTQITLLEHLTFAVSP